jgi:hypothetical protein
MRKVSLPIVTSAPVAGRTVTSADFPTDVSERFPYEPLFRQIVAPADALWIAAARPELSVVEQLPVDAGAGGGGGGGVAAGGGGGGGGGVVGGGGAGVDAEFETVTVLDAVATLAPAAS